MTVGSDSRPASAEPADDRPMFALDRFEWGAPDRLELAGRFSGLEGRPAAGPVLMVDGPDGPHRLPAVGDGAGPPADGAPWAAAFAWLEAPVAFDHARLELGPALAVELPGPGQGESGRSLPVSTADDGTGAADVLVAAADADGAAGRLRLEAQLLDARQELEETRVAAQRAQEELERAQADLAAERRRASDDAERFRAGLASVRASAEEAIGAAELARSRAEQEAQAEIAALRERVAALEPAADELETVRSELDDARSTLAEVRVGAQSLLGVLARDAEAQAEGR
jgi:hypothetical protein